MSDPPSFQPFARQKKLGTLVGTALFDCMIYRVPYLLESMSCCGV